MGEPGTTDTWWISGPTFLELYALLALLVAAYWVWTRHRLRAPWPPRSAPDGLAHRPDDLAFLNGGPELAVYAALSSMRMQDGVTLFGGIVTAAGPPPAGASELARAIHQVSTKPVHRAALPIQPRVLAVLDASADRLVRAGLLVSEAGRQQLRRIALGMLAVLVLGVARLVDGAAGGHPVGLLMTELALVVMGTIVLFAARPRRTRLGDLVLGELKATRHELAPASHPDWTVYGASAAALGVALYGVPALWASDPAMATELAAQRGTAGGGNGGSGGGCGGGCGGCGG